MELILFLIILGISLVLIAIGLFKSEESAQALIGFLFLFILSFSLITNDLQIPYGETIFTTYSYSENLTASTSSLSTPVYYSPDTKVYGIFLSLLAAGSFVLTTMNTKGPWSKK